MVLWGWINVLRNSIFTGILLIAAFVIVVILYRRANKLVNELMNDITPINELLTKPGNIVETIKQLEGRNVIDDISKIIKKRRDIKEVLRYLPILLLSIFTAAFVAFSAAFTVDVVLHPLMNMSSYDAITAGAGIAVLAALTLAIMNLTTKTTETTNQRPTTNQGVNYMGAYARDIVNNYLNPTKTKSILSHPYKAIHYVLLACPKLKLSINTPRPYVGVYVCNDKLREKLVELFKKYLYLNQEILDKNTNDDERRKIMEEIEKVIEERLETILDCKDNTNMSRLKDFLEIESPYELLSLDNPNLGELFLLIVGNKWVVMLIKAWKGCAYAVRDIVSNVDPRFNRVRIKCERRRVITVFTVGHEELLGELDLILNLYGKPPNYG